MHLCEKCCVLFKKEKSIQPHISSPSWMVFVSLLLIVIKSHRGGKSASLILDVSNWMPSSETVSRSQISDLYFLGEKWKTCASFLKATTQEHILEVSSVCNAQKIRNEMRLVRLLSRDLPRAFGLTWRGLVAPCLRGWLGQGRAQALSTQGVCVTFHWSLTGMLSIAVRGWQKGDFSGILLIGMPSSRVTDLTFARLSRLLGPCCRRDVRALCAAQRAAGWLHNSRNSLIISSLCPSAVNCIGWLWLAAVSTRN